MDLNKEKIIYYTKIGAGLAIAFLLYKFIRTKITKAKVLRDFGSLKTMTKDDRGNKGGFSLSTEVTDVGFQPRSHAQRLFSAMKGWGTDEEMIWTTLEPLTKEQRTQVRKYFNTYFGNMYSLDEWFAGDLSGKDLQRARSYFM